MAIGTNWLGEEFSKLYMNEKLSDVTIVVDNVKLPGHSYVLAQRSRYFEAMFASGMIETISKQIEVHETSIDGFKSVLKWIYAGTAKFKSINSTFDALHLTQMYELECKFQNMAIDFLKDNCASDNVCLILNEAVLLSLDVLCDFAIEFVSNKFCEILKHESFQRLSVDALNEILTRVVVPTSHIDVFHAVVGWMKANFSKSAAFTGILENVVLDSITVKDMANLPSDVLNAVVCLVRQKKTSGSTYCLKDENVALAKYGVKVIAGGATLFFEEKGNCYLKHIIKASQKGIVIDLGCRFKLNSFKMQLANTGNNTFSYFIAVSENNVNWSRVIDHSKYPCHSVQNLYFKERPVRYIRICGTAPVNDTFQILYFKGYYTTELFKIDPDTTLNVPLDNKTMFKRCKTLIELTCEGPFNGFAELPNLQNVYLNGIKLQLAQPYLYDSVQVKFLDQGGPASTYYIEVSADGISWARVFSGENNTVWHEVHLNRQPVVFLNFYGIYNSKSNILRCVEMKYSAVFDN
uniref:BTB domain-containing protein n=1 Tax=Panagrellus redivivus TaxID=6233 RepID=A0A7E4VL21_PANRE